MKPRDAAVIACKGLAIYALVCVLDFLQQTFSILSMLLQTVTTGDPRMVWQLLLAIPPVLLVVAAFILWRYSDRIADRIVGMRPSDVAESSGQVDPTLLQGVFFTIVGVFLIAITAPDLIYNVVFFISGIFWPDAFLSSTGTVLHLIGQVLKIGVGVSLILGSKLAVQIIPRAIHWLRVAGRPRVNGQGEDQE